LAYFLSKYDEAMAGILVILASPIAYERGFSR